MVWEGKIPPPHALLFDRRKVAGEMVKYTSDAYAVFKKFYIEQAVETFGHPNA
jgi:hypothetical protein